MTKPSIAKESQGPFSQPPSPTLNPRLSTNALRRTSSKGDNEKSMFFVDGDLKIVTDDFNKNPDNYFNIKVSNDENNARLDDLKNINKEADKVK